MPSTYVICLVDVTPCPSGEQVAIAELGVQHFASIGVTPESIAAAFTLGFGMVFFAAVLGMVTGIVVRMVRNI